MIYKSDSKPDDCILECGTALHSKCTPTCHQMNLLLQSWYMKTGAAGSSETSEHLYQTTKFHIPKQKFQSPPQKSHSNKNISYNTVGYKKNPQYV